VTVELLQHVHSTSYRHTNAVLCGYLAWCNAKGVVDREILETFSNSAFKNTSETDIFPQGPKILLTSINYCSGTDQQAVYKI
jgi:hypothetical protein